MSNTKKPERLDLVAVVRGAEDPNVEVGDVGTVAALLPPDGAEVEFVDRTGKTRCLATFRLADLLVLKVPQWRLKLANSSAPSWNMRSSGNRSMLRRTARVSALVIRLTGQQKARFVTAFAADSQRTLNRIKGSPRWTSAGAQENR